MKQNLSETVHIPSGVHCEYKHNVFSCKQDGVALQRTIHVPGIAIEVGEQSIKIHAIKGNKRDFTSIKSTVAHMHNMFKGLKHKYKYTLEACNVHFPMTLKLDKSVLTINNFLGEKVPRHAKILDGVEVEIKGTKITITSSDKEAAGQTAANMETATKVRNRDRRVFQDGIFITSKPEDNE